MSRLRNSSMSSGVGAATSPPSCGRRLERGDDDLLALGELEDRFLHRPHFVQVGELARPGGRRAGRLLADDQPLRRFPIPRHDERIRRGQHAARDGRRQPQLALRPHKPRQFARRQRSRDGGIHDPSRWAPRVSRRKRMRTPTAPSRHGDRYGARICYGNVAHARLEFSLDAGAPAPMRQNRHTLNFRHISRPSLLRRRQPMFEKSAEAEARPNVCALTLPLRTCLAPSPGDRPSSDAVASVATRLIGLPAKSPTCART